MKHPRLMKMKVKITFLVVQVAKKIHFTDPKHFKILLDANEKIPSQYMSTKDEEETLRDIAEKNLNIDFDWMYPKVCGFKRLSQQECEVVYLSVLPPIDKSAKSGFFIPQGDLEKYKIKIDPYHARLLSERSRGF